MENLGAMLSQLRKEKGLSQKELGICLNLSISAISSYENNIHSPDLAMLCRLAEFFGVTTDYLLGRTEYRCSPETLNLYITADYTMHDMVNTILSLDQKTQASVVNFVKYMKHLYEETSSRKPRPK